jgi:hypothetical protein
LSPQALIAIDETDGDYAEHGDQSEEYEVHGTLLTKTTRATYTDEM